MIRNQVEETETARLEIRKPTSASKFKSGEVPHDADVIEAFEYHIFSLFLILLRGVHCQYA